MAKSKSKKGRWHKPKSVPMGVTVGAMGFAANVLLSPGPGAVGGGAPALNWFLDRSQTPITRLKYGTSSMMANLKEPNTYYPLVGGALISAAPRVPFVNKIANPVNSWLKTVSGGKLRL